MAQIIRDHSLATHGKKWLVVTLAAAALTLSACGKKDEPMTDDPMANEADNTAQTSAAQPSVEQAQAGTDVGEATSAPVMDNNAGVASADNNDGMGTADGANDDIATASADDTNAADSNMVDGTESGEHISTY